MNNEEKCEFPAVCDVIFRQLRDSVDHLARSAAENHKETNVVIKALSDRVMNGLTEQLQAVRRDVSILQQQRVEADQARAERSRRSARWESGIISIVVAASAGLLWFTITAYVHSQSAGIIKLLPQQPALIRTNAP